MRRDTRKHAIELVSVATGGDSTAVAQIQEQSGLAKADIKDILYNFGVPQAEVAKEDMSRVLSGKPPRYFAYKSRLERQFRQRLGIPKYSKHPAIDHSEGAVHVETVVDKVLGEMRDDKTRDPYRIDGFACRHEQSAFYDSPEWQRRAKAVRAMDYFTCRSCHASNTELHVHHIQPIYSVHSRKFHRNFDVVRMRTLCKRCHMDLHEGAIKDVGSFRSASKEKQKEARQRRETRRAEHDEARDCLWCQRFEWDMTPQWASEPVPENSGDGAPQPTDESPF